MVRIVQLFDLVGGQRLVAEESGDAQRWQLVVRATLAAVLFGAVFGLAAGSTDPAVAGANVVKVPMVVLLSTLTALPAGLLAWKFTDTPVDATDLLVGVASGNFTATLVLAALSPLIALYYHSSAFMGAPVAMGAVSLAVITGSVNTVRSVLARRSGGGSEAALRWTVAVMLVVQLAALLQFIHVASPILPEVTVFDGGIDAMLLP